MTANERISKAKGECRHDTVPRKGEQHKCKLCGKWHTGPTQYDSDPAAWSPEHFQWIEEEGLKDAYIAFIMWPESFAYRLSFQSRRHGQVTAYEEAIERLAFSTPLQKATALDRALRKTKKPHA